MEHPRDNVAAARSWFAKDISQLNDQQRKIFAHLYAALERFFVRHSASTGRLYNWSAYAWLSGIVRLAQSIRNDVVNIEHDCWLADTGQLDHDQYPRFKVTDLDEPKMKAASQGKRLYKSERGDNVVKCYKFVVALANPELLLVLQESAHHQQTAHRCSHHPVQRCINPAHLIPVLSDAENKDMHKCVRADAASCPGHGPQKVKCIFVTADGRYIPCRNSGAKAKCIHAPNCWDIMCEQRKAE